MDEISKVKIDLGDAHWLIDYYWLKNSKGYLYRNVVDKGKKIARLLHRDILRLPMSVGRTRSGRIEVDHINGDPLDNRHSNLRLVTHAQQMQNKKAYRNNQSGFRGVYWDRGRWKAEAKLNGIKHYIGRFLTKEEASQAAIGWRKEHMPFAVNRP